VETLKLTPYADLLDRARHAFATDPAYAIDVARAAGAIIGNRAARLGLSVAEYDEHVREQAEADEQRRQRRAEARYDRTRRARQLREAGRGHAAIADELGCAVSTVSVILRRALPEDAESGN
jgi:DNA-binding NarL/FixJ family response regulator